MCECGRACLSLNGACATTTARYMRGVLRNAPETQATPSNTQGVHVILYQYQTCPFCNKVRAFLDMHGVPYSTVEVNPLTKAEMAWSKSYRNVPIAVVNGVQVNNSSDIINRVEDLLGGPPVGQGSMAASEVEEWCGWVDSTLAKTLAPNIYRTWDESLDSFAYISEHSNFGPLMGPVTKYTGAVLMYAISKRLKKKYGFQDEREALYSAVQQWLERGVADRRFAGGDTPNKADVEVFGVLRALEGYTTFRDLQENTRMAPWYAAMQEAVGPSAQQHALFTAPEQR